MSLTATILAFASGVAARLPKPEANADVEITRLKEELAEARRTVDALRLAMMRLIEERRPLMRVEAPQVMRDPHHHHEIVDCTGGGRYAHLMGQAQQYAALNHFNAQQAMNAQMNAHPFVSLGALGLNILAQIRE